MNYYLINNCYWAKGRTIGAAIDNVASNGIAVYSATEANTEQYKLIFGGI
jgi:hypothetical protein